MIVFFSNFLNHHQVLVADTLWTLTNHRYVFVSLTPMPESFRCTGYPDYSDRPYLLKAYENEQNMQKAYQLALTADVALFGDSSLPFEVYRLREGKLSLEVGERWFKRGWVNIFSPRLLKNLWYYHTHDWKHKPLYKLCSSAYGAGDQYKLYTFTNRCFKWGYFTEINESEVEAPSSVSTSKSATIIWCARFLRWKHPELPVLLARRLKDAGYSFVIDMYGDGPERSRTETLARNIGISDCVIFKGNVANAEILKAMREHHVFLFTSDQNEGWGAVLNEAMSNRCAVVATNTIGSVPYLIQDGVNGFIFESGNISSLYKKVSLLLDSPDLIQKFAQNAYDTIRKVWSPQHAAENLLTLIDDLKSGHDTSILCGPCSKA